MRKPSSHYNASQRGYGMIVIAALLAAFMAVVGSILEGNVVDEQIDRQTKAREQLSILSTALEQYAAFNGNRYPCPARPDLAYSNDSFGSAVANCHTGTPTGITIMSSSEVIRGMIPVRALAPYGLTLEDAFDPWGVRIMYVVNRNLTGGGTGVISTGPTLTEAVTSKELSLADFVLISYGKDHLGGVVRSQTSTMTATATCPAASTKIREENCDNDLAFIRRPINVGANVADANYFDDIITGHAGASMSDCTASKATWNTNCSHTLTATMPHGSSVTVANTGAGYVGSATVSCTNGAYVVSNNFCQPTGAGCTWASTFNTWNGTTDCANIPGWSAAATCENAGCTGTTVGTTTTYATASTNCANAICRENPPACITNYGGATNTATAQIRVCRPVPGCAAGATTWNTNCSGSYAGAAVGGTVNVSNNTAGYSGTISGTCQADGSISWGAGSCTASTCTKPWGGTMNDGESITAYQTALPVGTAGTCVSQSRTCSNGTLSGTYTNQTCHPGCTITYDGSAHDVAHGFYVTRYGSSSCFSGCVSQYCGEPGCCEGNAEEAWCQDGVVYGSNPVTYTKTTCSESYSCFVGDAVITMADGSTKPMAELKEGDKVKGKAGINTVLRNPVRTVTQTLYGFNGGKPIVTGGHPFHTTEGWKAFDPSLTPEEKHDVATTKLEVGDVLLLDNGKEFTVESITTDTSNAPVAVYNPMVDGDHTYYSDRKLVHNKCESYNCP